MTVLNFFFLGWAVVEHGGDEAHLPLFIFRLRPVIMLSSVLIPLNNATFWKVLAMPPAAASAGAFAFEFRHES